MNLSEARKILELPLKFNDEDLKKNYRRLAMKMHPDKCKDPQANEKFSKLNEAYTLLSQTGGPETVIDNLMSSFFKNFDIKSFTKLNKTTKLEKVFAKISPEEFFNKKFKAKVNGDVDICLSCAGCGFKSGYPGSGYCETCLGDGTVYTKIEKIFHLPDTDFSKPFVIDDYEFHLSVDGYFFQNGKMCTYFDITLKQSLLGFTKSFKDPFGKVHTIIVTDTVQNNDGYQIDLDRYQLDQVILVFRILYPKLYDEVKELLRKIDF